MSELTFLKVVIVICYLTLAIFGLAALGSIRQLTELPAVPLYIYAMGGIPIMMFVCIVAVIFFLTRYRKAAMWPAILLSTSPVWPFIVSLFAPAGIFGDVPFIPISPILLWAVLFGSIAFYARRMSQKGVFE